MKQYIYGVDIGGTNIKIGLFEQEDMTLITTESMKTSESLKLTDIARDISNKIMNMNQANHINEHHIYGIGIGMPCVIEHNIVHVCANLLCDIADFKSEIKKYFNHDIQIRIANDANVAAIGEHRILKGLHQNAVFITLGTGVGGGIILNNQLIEGRGTAGEIGHMKVTETHVEGTCGCGQNGCLEQLCGTKGMLEYAKELMINEPTSIKALTIKDIFDAAKENDLVGLKVVDRTVHYLAIAMANLAVIVEPDIFIIGGGIAASGTFLLDKIVSAYQEIARFKTKNIPVALAKLGNDAGLYGAGYLVKY